MRLLVTRPLEDAGRQAEMLNYLGHEVEIQPLLDLDFPPLTPLQFNGVQALIATSRNALRGLARNESFEKAKRLPVYCVGPKTAQFARQLGFTKCIGGQGTAKDLLTLIQHVVRADEGALLYLTGQSIAFDLERPLKAAGFTVPRVIIYEAREIGRNAQVEFARKLSDEVDGVILMSPRTAQIFASIIKSFKLTHSGWGMKCYCYSDAIAEPIREMKGVTISVASHPTEEDMMELIGPAPFNSSALADLQDVLGKR